MSENPIEHHPLKPFLPTNALLLMLGSFPPQQKRWCMDFYYPNLQNDMWRIYGYLFFGNKNHFVNLESRKFMKEDIIRFLEEKRIAIFDTAVSVRRLQDNASDKFLEIVEPTQINSLLKQIPLCQAIVTTGEKATDTICSQLEASHPKVGQFSSFQFDNRTIRLYRMPSSSRAYPLALEKKAAFYRMMFQDLEML